MAEGGVGQGEGIIGLGRARLCLECHREPMTVKQPSDMHVRRFTPTGAWSHCNSFPKTIVDRREIKTLPLLPNSCVGQECFHHSLG